ncbi:hypothetical protein OB955_07050 [Halobacteria archaeon AArc-m2/3/4]|uniref:Cyclophilin TM1367-like domain-containing protein n=1 Tax=Natronoglomus mannanivorans TaxID=2979990 RepID=A0ABT2QC41_9EURY|nr:hypothetical protein [Halobacteria archaeon AArc-m2/3/4]
MADCRLVVDAGDGPDRDRKRVLELPADWTDDAPETRDAVAAALPLKGDAIRWGDELYVEMETPVDVDPNAENAQTEVPAGSIAYWPTGNALCLFWGPTPASVGEEPRAASPVSVVAQVTDPSSLSELEDESGASMRLEPADDT